MPVKVKICGVRTREIVDTAVDAGADYIGLVFFPKSPRHLELEAARPLAQAALGRIETVAVTVDPDDAFIDRLVTTVQPTLLQLHGSETPDRVAAIRARFGLPIIKAIGVGLNETAMSLRFAREADLDCIMLAGRYTLLEQGALDELLPLCEKKNMSILLAAPLNSGILATGARAGATYDYQPAPAPILEKVRRIEAVCQRHKVDLTSAALKFPLAHPRLASIVAGALKPAEVRENMARMSTAIPADFWRELKQEKLLAEAAPVPT